MSNYGSWTERRAAASGGGDQSGMACFWMVIVPFSLLAGPPGWIFLGVVALWWLFIVLPLRAIRASLMKSRERARLRLTQG
jgi:hypothetical protein